MATGTVKGLLGQITHRGPEIRANSYASSEPASETNGRLRVARATKRGGCKTCDGRGCNGHCKF
jgi:hypothetical protein